MQVSKVEWGFKLNCTTNSVKKYIGFFLGNLLFKDCKEFMKGALAKLLMENKEEEIVQMAK